MANHESLDDISLETNHAAAASVERRHLKPEQVTCVQRKVLAVDDDLALLSALERILASAGYHVLTASSASEALALAGECTLDVALVDFGLPDRTGLELLEEFYAMQPSCIRILTSGQLDLGMAVNAVNHAHVSRVITKPFLNKSLLEAVAHSLAQRSQQHDLLGTEALAVHRAKELMFDECLIGDDIQLALQPIVNALSGEVHAYEALLRSSHRVLFGPAQVLAAAEEQGRLEDVADVVWSRARDWLPELPTGVHLFLNLHPAELNSPARLFKRASRLAPWADRVVIELTEQSSVLRGAHWQESLELLANMGFAIAVDDLGSGYNSLALLAELQPQYIKLDMSIVRAIHIAPRKQRLVSLLCRFADASGAIVVAEGIETQEEADTVIELGAHLLQGYWIGRPSLHKETLFGDVTIKSSDAKTTTALLPSCA